MELSKECPFWKCTENVISISQRFDIFTFFCKEIYRKLGTLTFLYIAYRLLHIDFELSLYCFRDCTLSGLSILPSSSDSFSAHSSSILWLVSCWALLSRTMLLINLLWLWQWRFVSGWMWCGIMSIPHSICNPDWNYLRDSISFRGENGWRTRSFIIICGNTMCSIIVWRERMRVIIMWHCREPIGSLEHCIRNVKGSNWMLQISGSTKWKGTRRSNEIRKVNRARIMDIVYDPFAYNRVTTIMNYVECRSTSLLLKCTLFPLTVCEWAVRTLHFEITLMVIPAQLPSNRFLKIFTHFLALSIMFTDFK